MRVPRIHFYGLCWNDARVLGFFFRHYDPLIERYVIFDDGSTDGSLEILAAHPRVEVRPFLRTHADSFILSERDHYDRCWKESRGVADWVIVADVDEHLVHPDLGRYLIDVAARGVTVVPALGYEMRTDDFPAEDERLCATRTRGAPDAGMSKLAVFAPDAIEDIRYAVGGHRAAPVGRVVAPARDEVALLHYKLLGLDYATRRFGELRTGLRALDLQKGWGLQYSWSGDEVRAEFERVRAAEVDIAASPEPWKAYPPDRWWGSFARAPTVPGE